jgi:xanthine dehydrogenase small subunit
MTAGITAPTVTVNGELRSAADVDPHVTALDWLRAQGLTGAKEGCAEGECGACSVLVARPGLTTSTEWTALNACLVPAAALDGQELVTAEGLGTSRNLHPVQREMAVRGGSQCGYCTPGFVCSMAAEYYRPDRRPAAGDREHGDHEQGDHEQGDHEQGDHEQGNHEQGNHEQGNHEHGPNGFDLHALSGNLCRCTGYRPIRDAAYALGAPDGDDALAARCGAPPPAARATRVARGDAEFVRPADLAEALALLANRPDATPVAGSTDWGVGVNLAGVRAPLVVAIDRLPELRGFDFGPDTVEIGAALSLTEVERRLDGRVPLLAQVFPQFASRLIRNGATLGGNLGTGSPIGDAAPALLALDATVVLVGVEGEREVALADYFTGYRRSLRRPGELIRALRVPLPLAPVAVFHKIAKRRFDDISSVAVGFALEIDDGVVRRARIGLGGVAATPVRARATEDVLTGAPWTADTARRAAEVMAGEGTPIDDHRASAAYRRAMLGQALRKLHADTQEVVR